MMPLAIFPAILNTLWQGVALAGLVWVTLRWVRVNAATRCVIWWAVLAMLVVLPIAPRLAVRGHVSRVAPTRGRVAPASYSLPQDVNEAPAIVTVPERPAARWPFMILGLWAGVFFYRLVRIGQSFVYLRAVKRNAAVSDVELPEVGRRARLLVSPDIASPMAVGFLRPAVILPADLSEQITREELDQIVLHEVAHLARRDDWWNLLGRLIGAALASGVFGRGSRIGDRIEMLLQSGRYFSTRVSLRRVAAGVFALCCLAAGGSFAPRWIAFAQAPSGKLAFEVASIRPHDGPLHCIRCFSSSGPRLTLEGYNLMQFVLEAYNLKPYQVSWAAAAEQQDIYYDVIAKAEGDSAPTKDEFRKMMQAMLAQRFNFKFHREMKSMPVWALVVGKYGPTFRESGPDDPVVNNHGVNGRKQNVVLSQGSIESLTDSIRGTFFVSDRPVLDKTGLTGKYTLKLEATPEFRINDNLQPGDISVFDAVQAQLGLKLESQKADIEVLVVDHMEKPSGN